MKMKKIIIAALAAATALAFCSCSDKQDKAATAEISETQTTASAAETTAEPADSLPTEEFCELPDEAEADLDYISDVSGELFPDAAGKKMYGFKGVQEIETDDGVLNCYVFDFYTYKSKVYTKIAEIAKDMDSADVYVLDEVSSAYELAAIPQREINWHEQATAALAVDAQKTGGLTDSVTD